MYVFCSIDQIKFIKCIYFLLKGNWSKMETVQRNKVSFQQTHEQHQIDAIMKLTNTQVMHQNINGTYTWAF